jgi:hypothetical protein
MLIKKILSLFRLENVKQIKIGWHFEIQNTWPRNCHRCGTATLKQCGGCDLPQGSCFAQTVCPPVAEPWKMKNISQIF